MYVEDYLFYAVFECLWAELETFKHVATSTRKFDDNPLNANKRGSSQIHGKLWIRFYTKCKVPKEYFIKKPCEKICGVVIALQVPKSF